MAVAGIVLELSGFVPGQEQPESALLTIRALATAVPALFLALAIAVARGYPITRARPADILDRLDGRR